MKTTAARPSWDEYFLNVAKAISMRSTCLRRKYGAVIVDTSNAIVSSGYNGSPVGEENCSDYGECKREELHVPKGERYELCKAVHAEQNAIINCTKQRMIGSTIYIYGENADGTLASGAPCLLCKRMIKNAGIKTVVFKSKYGVIMHIQASQLNNYKEEDPSKTIIPKDDSYTHTKVIVGFSLNITNHAPRLLTRSEYYLRCETIDAKKELNTKFGTWFLSGKGSAVIEYKHNKISLDIEVIKEEHPINEFGKTPAEMVEDICLVARTCDSLVTEIDIITGGGALSVESIKRKLDVVEANSVNDKGDKKEPITKIVNDIKASMFETLEKEESYTKSVISGLYSLCDKDGTSINTSSFIILYEEMDKFKETLQKMYGEANGTTFGFDDPEHHSLKIIFTKTASQDIRFYPVLTITEVIDAIDANYVNSTISYDEKGKIQTRPPYRRDRTINKSDSNMEADPKESPSKVQEKFDPEKMGTDKVKFALMDYPNDKLEFYPVSIEDAKSIIFILDLTLESYGYKNIVETNASTNKFNNPNGFLIRTYEDEFHDSKIMLLAACSDEDEVMEKNDLICAVSYMTKCISDSVASRKFKMNSVRLQRERLNQEFGFDKFGDTVKFAFITNKDKTRFYNVSLDSAKQAAMGIKFCLNSCGYESTDDEVQLKCDVPLDKDKFFTKAFKNANGEYRIIAIGNADKDAEIMEREEFLDEFSKMLKTI
jgi:dCMP deaminase